MKKLLTFFLTALLAFGVGWAAEVTFEITSSGDGLLAQITSTNQTVTSNGVTLTPDFITFFCHHIADIDYQSFRCVGWVN